MLALLPPSSSVTRLTCAAAPAMTRLPTSVEPVNTILRTSGWVTNRSPTTAPFPGNTCSRSRVEPRLGRQLTEPERAQRRPLGGFHQYRVARGQGGRDAPGRDHHREVPRCDHADHAQRFVEGDVEPAGDGNLLAGQAFRATGIERQHVADVAGFPFGRCDRVSRVGHLACGQFVGMGVDDRGECPQARRALRRRQPRPAPLGCPGPPHGVVDRGGIEKVH